MPVDICAYSAKGEAIDTTSRSKTWSQGLSPFYAGPCALYGGHVARNVENGWQYCKVYAEHVDAEGNPTEEYFRWAKAGWAKVRADRYPMGKGAKPLYSWWDGEKLDYVSARKKIYIPLYSSAVRKTEAFIQLKNLYNETGHVRLRDFDGYDYRAKGQSLKDVMHNPLKKMGHAFVLALMLTPSDEWDLKPSSGTGEN